jgi:hypothetical protein
MRVLTLQDALTPTAGASTAKRRPSLFQEVSSRISHTPHGIASTTAHIAGHHSVHSGIVTDTDNTGRVDIRVIGVDSTSREHHNDPEDLEDFLNELHGDC